MVVMYTTRTCPFCRRAEHYLADKGIVQIVKVFVDVDPAAFDAMVERTGRRTVPQIFVGDRYIGGFDNLVATDRSGLLDELLGVCG